MTGVLADGSSFIWLAFCGLSLMAAGMSWQLLQLFKKVERIETKMKSITNQLQTDDKNTKFGGPAGEAGHE